MMRTGGRERPEKILVAMYEKSGGTGHSLKYEDIVVEAFRRFPDEFALRGYPEYPDSSDIHKPLYGVLRRRGLVRGAHKSFALTPRGVEEARRLVGNAGGRLEAEASKSGDRMPRDMGLEVERMMESDAFRLFSNGDRERILDTDFYTFLGCTVRTPRADFLGRVEVTCVVVDAARRLKYPGPQQAKELAAAWEYLRRKYSGVIERTRGKR